MKVGSIIVGAAIGGLVWVFALRATGKAVDGATAPGGAPPPTTVDSDHDTIRDNTGSAVSDCSDCNGTSVASSTTATPGDLATAAQSATGMVPVNYQGDATVAGIDGNTGSTSKFVADPVNKTVTIDHNAPLGGQGVEQMSASANPNAPPQPPAYALVGNKPYVLDYVKARIGTTQGMTAQQVNAYIMEAARIGGLPL